MTTEKFRFFPPFSGSNADRALNLAVNANPYTFGIRAFFATMPQVAQLIAPLAYAIQRGQGLPNNLRSRDRIPEKPLIAGDRVTSPQRVWPGFPKFGGYVITVNRDWALVQWDFIPFGPLTYDPLDWLEPQVLR